MSAGSDVYGGLPCEGAREKGKDPREVEEGRGEWYDTGTLPHEPTIIFVSYRLEIQSKWLTDAVQVHRARTLIERVWETGKPWETMAAGEFFG